MNSTEAVVVLIELILRDESRRQSMLIVLRDGSRRRSMWISIGHESNGQVLLHIRVCANLLRGKHSTRRQSSQGFFCGTAREYNSVYPHPDKTTEFLNSRGTTCRQSCSRRLKAILAPADPSNNRSALKLAIARRRFSQLIVAGMIVFMEDR